MTEQIQAETFTGARRDHRRIAVAGALLSLVALSSACSAESFDGPSIPVVTKTPTPETITVTIPVPKEPEQILPAPSKTIEQPVPSVSSSTSLKKKPNPLPAENLGTFVADSAGCNLYEKPGSFFNLVCNIKPDLTGEAEFWVYKPENHNDSLGGGEAPSRGPLELLMNHRANEPFCVGYQTNREAVIMPIAKFNIHRYPTSGSC